MKKLNDFDVSKKDLNSISKSDFLEAFNLAQEVESIRNSASFNVRKILLSLKLLSNEFWFDIKSVTIQQVLNILNNSDNFFYIWLSQSIKDMFKDNDSEEQEVELKNIIDALNNSSIVQVIWTDGTVLDSNEKFNQITWLERDEYLWKQANIFKSWVHTKDFWKNLWKTVLNWNIFHWTICNKRKDWTFYWTDTTITPYIGDDWKIEKFIVIRHDVTDLVQTKLALREKNNELERLKESLTYENRQLIELSNEDALTWLNNRRYFDYTFETEVKNANLTWTPLSLIVLDIDNFKIINDTYWHKIWDLVLQKLWNMLKKYKRKQDISVRYWGEEFRILLPWTDIDWAKIYFGQLQEQIKLIDFKDDLWNKIIVTVSRWIWQLWIKEFPWKFFQRVDSALYTSKKSWKNKFTEI